MTVAIATLPNSETVGWRVADNNPENIPALVNRHIYVYEKSGRGGRIDREATVTVEVADIAEPDPLLDSIIFEDLEWSVDDWRLSADQQYYVVGVSFRESVSKRTG